MSYPPADDRLRHLLAQRINCHVDTWKLAFFIAGALVDDVEIRAELDRVAASHAAGEPCRDRNCRACFAASTTARPAGSSSLELTEAKFKENAESLNPAAAPVPSPADRATLRDRIAEALWPLTDWDGDQLNAEAAADAVLAVLPEQTDEERPLSPDYEHPECGFHWHGRDDMDIPMRDGQPVCPRCELRRLAAEQPTETRPSCPDPIECGHEAALGEARETNRRLNLRAQQLESELAAYRRAVRQWEVSERGTYIPHSSLRAIGKACGVDILGTVRHLKHFERVEQAEATIERVRAVADDLDTRGTRSMDSSMCAAAGLIRIALDGQRPAVGERPDTQTPEADRTVAYVLTARTKLHCLHCTPSPAGDIWTRVTAEELDDGGICAVCGRDVLTTEGASR